MTYEIKEYSSYYELVIPRKNYDIIIGTIWFDDTFKDMGMLNKEKAKELITKMKEEVEE